MNAISNLPPQASELSHKKMMDSYRPSSSGGKNKERDDLTKMKSEHLVITENLKQQYEHWLNMKNGEMEKFNQEAQKYHRKKKEQVKKMKEETLELFNTVNKYSALVEKLETGALSNGIRSVNIPNKEKPAAITRAKFTYLYKLLDKSRVAALPKTKEELAKEEADKKLLGPDPKKLSIRHDSKKSMTESTIQEAIKKDFKEEDIDIHLNPAKLAPTELRIYCENLQAGYKKLLEKEEELKKNADKFIELNVYGDINDIVKERDKYKVLYRDEVKKGNVSKIAVESQKRLLQTSTQFNSSGKIRPMSGLPGGNAGPTMMVTRSAVRLK